MNKVVKGWLRILGGVAVGAVIGLALGGPVGAALGAGITFGAYIALAVLVGLMFRNRKGGWI